MDCQKYDILYSGNYERNNMVIILYIVYLDIFSLNIFISLFYNYNVCIKLFIISHLYFTFIFFLQTQMYIIVSQLMSK